MPTTTATFRNHFFRVFIVIGILAAIVVTLVITVVDINSRRAFMVEDVERGATLIASVAAADFRQEDWHHNAEIVPLFGQTHNLSMACVYDHDNMLMREWQRDGQATQCPKIINAKGTSTDMSDVNVAIPLFDKDRYIGIVYAQAPLVPMKMMVMRGIVILCLFVLLALLVSHISAYFGARHMNKLMTAIRQQIDCLMGNSTSECMLTPAKATSETMAMFNAIRNLRTHLESRLVPKDLIIHLRQWYENTFTNLFSQLRSKMPEDSPMLYMLSDCELLLHINNPDDTLPAPETTDIARLIDQARAGARALHRPGNDVHLVASFKSGSAKECTVQASYLETLLRHVMLIGLSRTQSGLVCLRMETITQPLKMNRTVLSWQMEDSGPPMQQGILHSHLLDQPDRIISVADASWLLVVRITKRLKGTIKGENGPAGLILKGEIPLLHLEILSEYTELQNGNMAMHRRLVLLVGEPSDKLTQLAQLLSSFNCQVLRVANYILALEIAPALPFSSIVLAASLLKDEGKTALRRLTLLMDNKTMPTIPVWWVTNSSAAADKMEQEALGVSQILLAPVKQERVAQLCLELAEYDHAFFAATDPKIREEFSETMIQRLPEMHKAFMGQIRQVRESLLLYTRKPSGTDVIQNVHGVKSAALALGYMRIAVLMANLEHLLGGRQMEWSSANIAIIAECLDHIRL